MKKPTRCTGAIGWADPKYPEDRIPLDTELKEAVYREGGFTLEFFYVPDRTSYQVLMKETATGEYHGPIMRDGIPCGEAWCHRARDDEIATFKGTWVEDGWSYPWLLELEEDAL